MQDASSSLSLAFNQINKGESMCLFFSNLKVFSICCFVVFYRRWFAIYHSCYFLVTQFFETSKNGRAVAEDMVDAVGLLMRCGS